MKKTLLATALAVGFAGVVQAQTSVTLYGVVDGSFGYRQNKTKRANGTTNETTRTGLSDGFQNGSRFGLSGSEDLGDGVKAVFTLENGFSQNLGTFAQSSDGTTRLFGRQAWLGLKSDAWGQIRAGRDYNFSTKYVTNTISSQGDIYGLNGIVNSFTSGGGTVRADNFVNYETPVFSGFQVGVGYSFNFGGPQVVKTKGTADTNQSYVSTGLRYTNGPLALVASYDQLNKHDSVPGEKDVKSWIVGGSYNFDVATLHLGYGQDKDGVLTARLPLGFGYIANGYKTNNYSVGFTIPVSEGKVMLNWQSARLGGSLFKTNNLVAVGAQSVGKSSQNIYTAVYRYDLSKRTNVYLSGAYANGFAFKDTKSTEFVVGLRHGF